MPDPIFDPDPSGASDPDTVKVLRGAPDDMRDVRLRYRGAGGLLGRKTVRRSRAESALLDYTDRQGYSQEKVLTLSEAEHFLREARERVGKADTELAERLAAVDLTCPHCGVRRVYLGQLSFLTGELGMMGAIKELTTEVLPMHAYRCPTCGSTEFFADGFLPHPISPATVPNGLRNPG